MALGSFRLSYITFYALIAVFFVWILWNKTRFGKNIFAIGGNPEAAKVSGVNVALNLLDDLMPSPACSTPSAACWKPVVSARRPITSALCMNWTPSPPVWWAAYRSAAG